MTGDIDMAGNKVINLPTPAFNHEPATKEYTDLKFTSNVGFTMAGNIHMNSNRITDLPEPISETEPATRKWVTADFPTKTQILDGFTMNGILDLVGHSIEGVTVPLNVDDVVTTKKYCKDNFMPKTGGQLFTGFIMQGGIDMNNNRITDLAMPTSDAEPATKKYSDDKFASKDGFTMQGGIDMTGYTITNLPNPISNTEPVTKSYADDRYVRKTKLTTFEWFWGYANVKAFRFPTYKTQWPAPVRTDEITDDTNIELRHITLDNELLLIAEVQACTLHVVFRYYISNTTYHEKEIFTLPLTGKSRGGSSGGQTGHATQVKIAEL